MAGGKAKADPDKEDLSNQRNRAAKRVRELKELLSKEHASGLPVVKRPRCRSGDSVEKRVFRPLLRLKRRLGSGNELRDLSYEKDVIAVCTLREIHIWRVVRYGQITRDLCSFSSNDYNPPEEEEWPDVRPSLENVVSAPKGLKFREAVLSSDGQLLAVCATNLTERNAVLMLICAKTGQVRIRLDIGSCSECVKRRIALVCANDWEEAGHRGNIYIVIVAGPKNTLIKYLFYEGYLRLKSKEVICIPGDTSLIRLGVTRSQDGSSLIYLLRESGITLYSAHSMRLLFHKIIPGLQILGVIRPVRHASGAHSVHAVVSDRSKLPKSHMSNRKTISRKELDVRLVVLGNRDSENRHFAQRRLQTMADVCPDCVVSNEWLYMYNEGGYVQLFHANHESVSALYSPRSTTVSYSSLLTKPEMKEDDNRRVAVDVSRAVSNKASRGVASASPKAVFVDASVGGFAVALNDVNDSALQSVTVELFSTP